MSEEIRGEEMPLFQPKKTSHQFFAHLSGLCYGAVRISESLAYQCDEESFDVVLASLYQRLVAPAAGAMATENHRPSARFRQLMDQYDFLQRGMKRHAHLELPNKRRWMPYRQVHNGEVLAIDRVEVSNQIGQTAEEIQALATPVGLLKDFLSDHIGGRPTRYVLIADRLQSSFKDQSESDFALMQEDLEQAVDDVKRSGGEVLREVSEVSEFAQSLDKTLPTLASKEASTGPTNRATETAP